MIILINCGNRHKKNRNTPVLFIKSMILKWGVVTVDQDLPESFQLLFYGSYFGQRRYF